MSKDFLNLQCTFLSTEIITEKQLHYKNLVFHFTDSTFKQTQV